MKVLVTGGEGFIGSNLVDSLTEKGYKVFSLDNRSAISNQQFYNENREATYYNFDILNYELLLDLFKKSKFDIVFHLAAESRIQPTLENPRQACLTNFIGTQGILQCSKITKVKRVLYSSTSSAYGLKNLCPQREDMTSDCLNPYSVSKVAGEELCKMYNNLWGVKTVIFRYFNVYGERHPIKGTYAPVIGIFLRQKQDGEPMTIVGDGSQRRDFTHVKDVVRANILAMKSKNQSIFGEIFNVGTGVNHSVLEIAKFIGGDYVFLKERAGEAKETLADISKIRRELNYFPTVKLEKWIDFKLNETP